MYDIPFDDPPLGTVDAPVVPDGWVRYSAERAASIGILLVLATIGAVCKQRAYQMLLGASLLSGNLALILAILSRWRRPASGAWGLFLCCAIILSLSLLLAILSANGMFTVSG